MKYFKPINTCFQSRMKEDASDFREAFVHYTIMNDSNGWTANKTWTPVFELACMSTALI